MSARKKCDFDIDIQTDFFQEYDYEEGPVLGSGTFGTVHLVTSNDDPQDLTAMKKFYLRGLDMTSEKNQATVRMFSNEVQIMRRAQHPNIMPIFASVKTPEYLAILMPYYRRGTLNEAISYLDQSQQIKFIKQLCQVVEFIHDKKIIHGDIKPQNILIDDDDNVQLSDFGLAKAVPSKSIEIYMNFGTRAYRAPETMKDERVNPFKVDLFALGVTFWKMLLNVKPVHYKLYRTEMENAPHVPTLYRQIVIALIHGNPDMRPSASDILKVIEE